MFIRLLKRTRLRWRVLISSLLLLAAWFFIPRHADMESFDPDRMGQIEANMWRHYYEKKYLSLGVDLFLASHSQYGFSPWDSTRMAWYAAKAAKLSQPSQPRTQAFAVSLPPLIQYYQIIQHATDSTWKPDEIAPLELEWWVMRHEKATWQEYGEAITTLTARTYQEPAESVRPACMLRAEMMHYRDERRKGLMTEKDWQHISTELGRSWQMLKQAVTGSEIKPAMLTKP